MDQEHFRRLIARVLTRMRTFSPAAVELLMGTAAQESGLGRWLYQLGGGPGLGFFQMEPATLLDIWENYLQYQPAMAAKIEEVCGVTGADLWQLETNLAYQVAMARCQYARRPEPLPNPRRIDDMAIYWKEFYNTAAGRGTPAMFVDNYLKYCS